jgi:hypothetical protein
LPCVGTDIAKDSKEFCEIYTNKILKLGETWALVSHWLQEGTYIKFYRNPFASFRHMDATIPWLNFVFSGQRMHTRTAERWNHIEYLSVTMNVSAAVGPQGTIGLRR